MGRAWLIAILLWSAPFAEAADPSSARTIKQGEAFSLILPEPAATSDQSGDEVVARFGGRDWPVFSTPQGSAGVLLAVDIDAPLGAQEFVVERRNGDRVTALARGIVVVEDGGFGVQELSLPDKQVDLDSATLRRVQEEQRAMLGAMERITPQRWEGEFVMPTDGRIQHTFGRRRVINGQPRSPHSGEDISAPQGAPVAAINHGTVSLVADQFFSGKSVVVDHGLGLYSMYFHLSESSVRVGDRVAKSQLIGAVGATGRVSGPHLHWGVRLNGVRVDPLSLNRALTSVHAVVE